MTTPGVRLGRVVVLLMVMMAGAALAVFAMLGVDAQAIGVDLFRILDLVDMLFEQFAELAGMLAVGVADRITLPGHLVLLNHGL